MCLGQLGQLDDRVSQLAPWLFFRRRLIAMDDQREGANVGHLFRARQGNCINAAEPSGSATLAMRTSAVSWPAFDPKKNLIPTSSDPRTAGASTGLSA